MDSTNTKNDENIEEIYNLIKQMEIKTNNERERGEAISLLSKTYNLYENLLKQKGKFYIAKNCPDVPMKLKGLVDKLTEYNS